MIRNVKDAILKKAREKLHKHLGGYSGKHSCQMKDGQCTLCGKKDITS